MYKNKITEISNDGSTVCIRNIKGHIDTSDFNCSVVKALFVSGCVISDFSFLDDMPGIEKLVFLDNKSDVWHTMPGNTNVRILRLHTMRNGKTYLDNIDFIAGFPGLKYLYLNNFNIEKFPDVSKLTKLHTVLCSGRKLIDFSELEHVALLTTYLGWSATDNHRTPAEAFIPILKNPALRAFEHSQMSNVETRKLAEYIRINRPDIDYPINKTTFNDDGTYTMDSSKARELTTIFF